VRFEDIVGGGAIPLGSTILSATLTVTTPTDVNNPGPDASIFKVLQTWADTDDGNSSVWSAYGDGVQTNGFEAASAASGISLPLGSLATAGNSATFDVTSILQDWANGEDNFGFLINVTGGMDDTLRLAHSEYMGTDGIGARPLLTVEFLPPAPEPSSFLLLGLGLFGLASHARRQRQRA
jgi:hypothetical protein